MSRISRAAVTAATAFAAVAVAASPASAWTGGTVSGSASPPVVFTMGGITVTCTSSFLSGSISPGGALTKEVFPDGLHLSPKGYEIWASELEPVLKKTGA